MDVHIDLDRELIAVETEAQVFCQLTVAAPTLPRPSGRKPLNIAVSLDRSGSMAGQKLAHAIHAVQLLVDQLAPGDIFSLVAFDDNAHLVIPAGEVTDKHEVKKRIRAIGPGGGTNLSEGWFAGVAEAKRHKSEDWLTRVLVLTDGQANQGVTDPAKLVEQAHTFLDEGVELSTLGYGSDFNEDLLRPLAVAGRGNFYYIETPDHAPAAFDHELKGLLTLVAQSIKVRVKMEAIVRSLRLLNDLPTMIRDGWLELTLGNLAGGDRKIVIFTLDIGRTSQPGRTVLGEIDVEYDWIVGDIRHETHGYIVEATHVAGSHEIQEKPRLDVMENVVRMASAQARHDSIAQADRGEFDGAKRTLQLFCERYRTLSPESRTIREELDLLETERRGLDDRAHYKEHRKRSEYRSHSISMTASFVVPAPPTPADKKGPDPGKTGPSS